MEFQQSFEKFKLELRDKWLDYYEINLDWIHKLMDSTNRWYKLSEGSRPDSMFVLGAVSALDENARVLLNSFLELSSDYNKLVKALGLDFDPDIELDIRDKMRIQEAKSIPLLGEAESKEQNSNSDPDTDYLNQIRQDMNPQHPPP
ncbi:DUF5331 domain-containing protein [Oscillatoria sp. FACHB-1406]|uniref:DUF5331 domain-containing protein n=1 Tax=Oscillatoria sp. FACHB-1406 TaxID=2692846 RepID=UPI00168746E6|nr:DUF5331 domain-containing protein [Oscillatoria sp. FACHB-1406]MBD2577655.1 hypothetical protein [Oscillatoria sp. FACHB-1406]